MWESRWEKDREEDEVEIITPYETSPFESGYYYGSKVHTIVRELSRKRFNKLLIDETQSTNSL